MKYVWLCVGLVKVCEVCSTVICCKETQQFHWLFFNVLVCGRLPVKHQHGVNWTSSACYSARSLGAE